MKTLEEFLNEIADSEELLKELDATDSEDALEAFLKKNGCEASAAEFADVLSALAGSDGEITDDDAEAVAGGDLSGLSERTLKKLSNAPRYVYYCVNPSCPIYRHMGSVQKSKGDYSCSICHQLMRTGLPG